MDIGGPELLIIIVVGLLLFGPKKIPELARALGQAQREFRNGMAGLTGGDDADEVTDQAADPAPSTTVDPASQPKRLPPAPAEGG